MFFVINQTQAQYEQKLKIETETMHRMKQQGSILSIRELV